jgi:predicted nucleotidyltransferase
MYIPIKDDLSAIVHEINALLPDAKVYLFGSYATETQKDDSDIDLCVVAPEYHERRMQVLYSLRVAIRDSTRLPVDILAFTNEEFERRSKMKPTIQYAVANEGVLLNG